MKHILLAIVLSVTMYGMIGECSPTLQTYEDSVHD